MAVENATVPICFADQKDKVYNLPWPDLLQENELPFQSYEDLTVGKVVLAPWKHRGSGIQFSKACVVDAGECERVCLFVSVCVCCVNVCVYDCVRVSV